MERKYVIFKVGSELYGVDIETVKGIENIRDVVPVPNSVETIKGIINLRDEIIPIFNLHRKFGKPDLTSYDAKTKFIVMNLGEMALALEVDEVYNIAEVNDIQVHILPVIITNKEENFITSIVNLDGQLVAIVNAALLLREAEKESLLKTLESLKE